MRRLIGLTLIAALWLSVAQGAERIWTGAADRSASNPANWQDNALPVDGDTVVLQSGDLEWDLTAELSGWRQPAAYTGTVTLAKTLTVTGDLELAGGVLEDGGHTIALGGDWRRGGGTLRATGLLDLTGGDQGIYGANDFASLRKVVTTAARTAVRTVSWPATARTTVISRFPTRRHWRTCRRATTRSRCG